ncbi:MAG: SIMPL domain-containing protein [Candidatus Uhrbacteria bacterium]|nr:SIMPL domain-containing protein [Candidatus Uhrbacteria bacterium]
MSNGIKNLLGLAGVITILCLAGSSLWYVNAYSRNSEPTSFRSFSATGNGKAAAVPDVARFTARVITQGDTNLGNSQIKNTEKINAVIAFVKTKNVEPKDIKTQNYSVEPRYQYFNCSTPEPIVDGAQNVKPCPPPQIVGYTVDQTIAVTVREKDFGSIGAMLSGVVTNGANSVSQLSFEVDDPTAVQNQARAQAIEKAKAKAASMAQAGGFSLGRLLSIDEGSSPQPYYDRYYSAPMATSSAMEKTSAPTIEPGSQDVTVDVTLKYEIQ